MIILLKDNVASESPEGLNILRYLSSRPGIKPKVHSISGAGRLLTEIYVVVSPLSNSHKLLSETLDILHPDNQLTVSVLTASKENIDNTI